MGAKHLPPLEQNPEINPDVYILDFYLSKLPVGALLNDTFYMCPLPAIPPAAHLPWFTKQRMGKNAIAGLMTKMCKDAGIVGPRTSHFLRVTAATSLYEKQVPEKLIQERTGHRSLGALRISERTSAHQQEAVSRLLVGSKRLFEEEMSAGGTNKRVKSENVQQPGEQKPACLEKGMFVQNCVVNVYSDGQIGDVAPVKLTLTHTRRQTQTTMLDLQQIYLFELPTSFLSWIRSETLP